MANSGQKIVLSSFISEHSVEFVLVPQFAEILSKEYPSIIPIYFWSSREGGKISRNCFAQNLLRIVALFPRRPKILLQRSSTIFVKFNDILFKRARKLEEMGIPVFAGVPLIASLDELSLNNKCSWFKINPNGQEEIIDLSSENPTLILTNSIKEISPSDVAEYVKSTSKLLLWSDCVAFFKSLRSHSDSVGYWPYLGDIYKPIYFLLSVQS
jgi:hypothetical protein